MKKLIFRLTLLYLVICLGVSGLASCSPKEGKVSESSEKEDLGTVEEGSKYDANGYLLDDLPETDEFKGETVKVFTWKHQAYADWGEKNDTVTTVSRALVKRDNAVMERFGVDFSIKTSEATGEYSSMNDFIKELEVISSAGDKTYHIVGQYTLAASIGVDRGLYKELLNTDIPYLDLSKPWWLQSLTSSSKIGENMYFLTGDLSYTTIKNVNAIYVNKTMYNNLGLSQLSIAEGRSIYEIVKDGDWTFEMISTMANAAYNTDQANMRIGFEINGTPYYDDLFHGAGFRLVENSEDGLSMHSDLTSERLATWNEMIRTFVKSDAVLIGASNSGNFYQGKSLFFTGGLGTMATATMRDVAFDYAVVPQFKYDSAQPEYISNANFYVTLYTIPVQTPDVALSGLILEALGSQSHRQMVPTIYYDAYRVEYSPTADDSIMFDYVCDGLQFDTGRVYTQINAASIFRMSVIQDLAWTTYYKGVQEDLEIACEELFMIWGQG